GWLSIAAGADIRQAKNIFSNDAGYLTNPDFASRDRVFGRRAPVIPFLDPPRPGASFLAVTSGELMSCLRFDCPACGVTLSVPPAAAGVSGPCPKCWQEIVSPDPARGQSARLAVTPPPAVPPAEAAPEPEHDRSPPEASAQEITPPAQLPPVAPATRVA